MNVHRTTTDRSLGSAELLTAMAVFVLLPTSACASIESVCGPEGRVSQRNDFKQVAVGQAAACGLTTAGRPVCWGSNRANGLEVPEGTFESLSAGLHHFCGLRQDGSVVCWGSSGNGRMPSPQGRFVMTTGGREHHCGIRTDGAMACWGASEFESAAPVGTFVGAHAGNDDVCVHLRNGRVLCFGEDVPGPMQAPPTQFRQVTVGSVVACGLRSDDTAECWGLGEEEESWRQREQAVRVLDSKASEQMRAAATQGQVAAGVQTVDMSLSAVIERDTFAQAQALGTAVGSGLVAAGAPKWLAAMGSRNNNLLSPPSTRFAQISASWAFSVCGVRTDHQLECWGALRGAQDCPTPSGEYTQVATGWLYACAVRKDGRIACWGVDTDRQCAPPGSIEPGRAR